MSQCVKRPEQIPENKNSSRAKTVEKKSRVKEAMGKIIEQVISTIILILDVLIKIILRAIAHQNSHVQPKCEKNVMPQTPSSLEK